MATPTITLPFGIRERSPLSGRQLPSPLTPFVNQTLTRADVALAQPFVGITTDGRVEPGLFSLVETGVSTKPIKQAADEFLASLTKSVRSIASFAMADDAWQRWNNTHPFTMRHGVMLESLTGKQRERAQDLVQTSLSVRGFETARDIMKLNHTIGELTEKWDEYGEWLYWLSIFGTLTKKAFLSYVCFASRSHPSYPLRGRLRARGWQTALRGRPWPPGQRAHRGPRQSAARRCWKGALLGRLRAAPARP